MHSLSRPPCSPQQPPEKAETIVRAVCCVRTAHRLWRALLCCMVPPHACVCVPLVRFVAFDDDGNGVLSYGEFDKLVRACVQAPQGLPPRQVYCDVLCL